jgi:hypothetical protein
MSIKVVINDTFGGFGLSQEARDLYRKRTYSWCYFIEEIWDMTDEEAETRHINDDNTVNYDDREFRTDPVFVQIVEELGERASGRHALLKVVEIPDDVKWVVKNNNGNEWIAEVHRTWS